MEQNTTKVAARKPLDYTNALDGIETKHRRSPVVVVSNNVNSQLNSNGASQRAAKPTAPYMAAPSDGLDECVKRINENYEKMVKTEIAALEIKKAIGDELRRAKTIVGQNDWMRWFQERRHRFPFSHRTANNYMRFSREWPKISKAFRNPSAVSQREVLELLAEPKEETRPTRLPNPLHDHDQCRNRLRDWFAECIRDWDEETVVFLATRTPSHFAMWSLGSKGRSARLKESFLKRRDSVISICRRLNGRGFLS